jgi:hypothetical protein
MAFVAFCHKPWSEPRNHRERRMMRVVRYSVLAAICLVALAVSPGRAGGAQMFEHVTEHYRIQTDVSPQMAVLVGSHMETIFRQYSHQFADYGQIDERFNIIVVGTRASYRRLVPRAIAGSTGFFMADRNLLGVNVEGRTSEEVFRTLYHEGFHQFMFRVISRDCPAWLNEGIAEYFAEATWDGEAFELGQISTTRLYIVQMAIRERSFVPFSRLLDLDPGQWLQNVSTDQKRADIYYSQAWSIVHFLIHAENGRYADMLNSYLRALRAGRDPKRASSAIFGDDVDAFQAVWARYVMSLRPSAKFTCRDNMEILLLLAEKVYGDPRRFENVADLRRRLYTMRQYRWEIRRPLKENLQWSDREAVAALFRCPFDQTGSPVSHLVVRTPGTNMPMLVCDHHPGIIIKAYYRQDRNGRRVVVEEQVRETVTPDLRQAMRQAYAAQFR